MRLLSKDYIELSFQGLEITLQEVIVAHVKTLLADE